MPKSLRWLTLPSLALGLAMPAAAATIGIEEARSVALEFMSSRAAGASLTERPVFTGGTEKAPLYYVFNSTDGGAFVIVSAEDTTSPVLGYSFEGGYAVQTLPEPMKWMMEGLERELQVAPTLQNGIPATERRQMARRAGEKAAAKLLQTADWSQEGPFNNLIPGRPLVGCVGTAMATIMKYHNWPATGSGSFGGVDFNTAYDWDNMRSDNYRSGYTEAEATAVATLMLHASKSIDTQYAMSGSSAYEVRVPGALSAYFGYDPGVSYKKRAEVATQQAWDDIVKAEIDADRPVLYCGQDVTAGHAFVCDGYEGNYLHFNWGWGGSANGYFLSTMLNPTVSRTHYYNNLNTIIYNIHPASGEISNWSDIHITADGNQPGIGSDMTDLSNGTPFTVKVGNLKNLAYDDFSGKMAVALCAANGAVKALLSGESNFSLPSMQTLYAGYVTFSNCRLPAGTAVADTDRVRLVTKAAGADAWLPVAGELMTVNELTPVSTPATFNVTLASQTQGATMTGEPSVIRGWDYSFTALLDDPANDVLTVKANGVVLTPNANNVYTISNVREDQLITLIVQKAADVKEKRNIWVGTPGTLASLISEEESGTIKDLTLFGSIDANDFAFMRDKMKLSRLDISGVYIAANGTNQANAVPREAFRGCGSLKQVVLPNSVNRLNNGCFRQCGITSIVIPANVKTYEYNIFVAATSLRDIYVGRETAEFINWCVLSGVKVDQATLHVPTERAWTNYSKAENWNTIKNIIVDPAPASEGYLFAVAEDNDVMFETATPTGVVAPGTEIAFTADYIADNDNRMEVYANSTLLTPDANGVYRTKANANTIVHFEMVSPIAIDANNKSPWKLTAANGSIGMLTEAVNIIPGQDFTVRLNALEIPQGFEQLYWAIALTDADGNIKEFVSPVNVWSAGAAKNHKLNVNCRVVDSKVREGNQLRVVTSAMKKIWNLVDAVGEDMVAALPALNNMTPVYNITIPEVEGVNISGAVATAIRGKDLTIKMTPANPALRLNVTANGEKVVGNATSVNYSFVAMEDVEFGIELFDPKAGGVAEFNVAPGTFHEQLKEETVAETVILHGSVYSLDLQAATGKKFAMTTIKTLDLSDVTIVQDGGYAANVVSHPFFVPTNSIESTVPSVIEKIILPDNVVRILGGVFSNCANIKEISLPKDIMSVPVQVTSWTYQYGLADEVFKGCNSLETIYIPGEPQKYNGNLTVAHHNPWRYDYYNLGHQDPKKVTVVVPEEYYTLYKTANSHQYYGNPWLSHGYNILAEYPVYGLTFDPTRIIADEDLDLQKTASFLGNNVPIESLKVEGKLKLANPDVKCRVFDNGTEIELAEDGTIPVTFYNPAKKADLAGNHHLEVVNFHDVNFASSSPLFAVTNTAVANETYGEMARFDDTDAIAPVLRDVAENSTVTFGVDFASEHAEGLEVRVMLGQQELVADEDGLYTVDVANASRTIEIFAVPGEGAVLGAEDIDAIHPADAAAVTSIALEGDMTAEQLSHAMEIFSSLENLDLSNLNGELPENAFAGMDHLAAVVLPEVEGISAGLFNGCSSLQTIEIPASVNTVGADAFKDCSSLETIRLTGVTEIGEGAFDGCSSLTNVTLLADVAGQNGASKPRRSNVHADAFKGINPNCIVILDEGMTIPAAKANYVATTSGMISELQPDGSEIEREGRIYSAAGDIALTAGAPLAIPHAFNLEGYTVTLDGNYNMLSPVVLPFVPATIQLETGSKVEVVLPEARTAALHTVAFYSAVPEEETLAATANLQANHPYLAIFSTAGNYTFTASEGKVASTPSEMSAEGKDYTIHASYATRQLPASETYLLNTAGTAFVNAAADMTEADEENPEEQTVEIAPFMVYATSPVATTELVTGIKDPSYGVAVDEVIETDGLRMTVVGGELQIWTPDARELKLYALDGRLVKVLSLEAGLNTTRLPEPGVYIVGKAKIRF